MLVWGLDLGLEPLLVQWVELTLLVLLLQYGSVEIRVRQSGTSSGIGEVLDSSE